MSIAFSVFFQRVHVQGWSVCFLNAISTDLFHLALGTSLGLVLLLKLTLTYRTDLHCHLNTAFSHCVVDGVF